MTTIEVPLDLIGDAISLGVSPRVWLSHKKMAKFAAAWMTSAHDKARELGYDDVKFVDVKQDDTDDSFTIWLAAHESTYL